MSADELSVIATVSMAAHGRYWLRLDTGTVFWDAEGLDGCGDGMNEGQLLAIAEAAGFAIGNEKFLSYDRARLRVLMPPEMIANDADRLRPLIGKAVLRGLHQAIKGA